MKNCISCNKELRNAHFNRKRCPPCAFELVKKPKHNLTPEQQLQVRRLAGTMKQDDIGKAIGASRTAVIRFASQEDISLDSFSYPESIVKQVCKYYEKHGKAKTQEKFPKVKVRSIIDRHKLYSPRTIPWQDAEIIELARMAGVISLEGQAKYFNRPNANKGSIVSAWMKKFGMGGGSINGLPHYLARHVVDSRCPETETAFGRQRKKSGEFGRRLYLWVDIEKHLKPDVDPWFRDAVKTMAEFQRWLHGVKDVRGKVKRIIEKREAENVKRTKAN
jgi:hypothetical protein